MKDSKPSKEIQNDLKIKSVFLANMSHNLRSPMTGITGLLTLLEDTKLSKEQSDYIGMLKECSINLMTIINDILDYSKLEAGKVILNNQCIDFKTCIESANDIILSQVYKNNIEYTYEIDSKIPITVKCDYNRLKQVLLNLLSNSIKFTKNGSINLKIEMITRNILKFTIRDTGCGIDETQFDCLFKAFSQTDSGLSLNYKEGTGLGLAICKQIIQLMNGTIWLEESQINKGTTICFEIKTDECDGDEYIEPLPLVNDVNFKNKRVFIIDDKLHNRLSLSRMVIKWGMIATVYTNATEALYFLKTTTFDLGLVDICMPDTNGIEFATKFIKQNKNLNKPYVPLIALSSLGENIIDGIFKDYLIKPVKESKLKSICNSLFINTLVKDPNHNVQYSIHHADNLFTPNESKELKENIRILIVEDMPTIQFIIKSYLYKLGYNSITIVDNGKKCIEILEEKTFEIILLDIKMPIMDGETVLKYLKDYFNGNKHNYIKLSNKNYPYIIATTAYALADDHDKYLNIGFDNYLSKPININKLNECMNTFLKSLF